MTNILGLPVRKFDYCTSVKNFTEGEFFLATAQISDYCTIFFWLLHSICAVVKNSIRPTVTLLPTFFITAHIFLILHYLLFTNTQHSLTRTYILIAFKRRAEYYMKSDWIQMQKYQQPSTDHNTTLPQPQYPPPPTTIIPPFNDRNTTLHRLQYYLSPTIIPPFTDHNTTLHRP